jgi:hypothetical protein
MLRDPNDDGMNSHDFPGCANTLEQASHPVQSAAKRIGEPSEPKHSGD